MVSIKFPFPVYHQLLVTAKAQQSYNAMEKERFSNLFYFI